MYQVDNYQGYLKFYEKEFKTSDEALDYAAKLAKEQGLHRVLPHCAVTLARYQAMPGPQFIIVYPKEAFK